MNSGLLQKNEETAFRLRGLYRSYGYQPYKMSKFEEYDLYVRNKSFLLSENILTFTDLDGKLMALKPDVTLSILKNGRGGPGLQKVYYSENVYRPSATAGGFREIPQTGLECIGSLDAAAEGEVLMLAAKSLAVISPEYLLDVSHQGFVAGLLEGLDLPDETRRRALAAMGAKNTPALERLAAEGYEGAITLHIAPTLSGTMQAAELAAQTCQDLGEGGLALKVGLVGKLCVFTLTAPMLLSLLEMILELTP